MPHLLDLDERRREPEWMDRPDLAPDLHRQALDGLSRIHRVSFTARRIRSVLAHESEAGRSLRVLEVGSGGGDVLTALARHWPEWVFHGVDISPLAVDRARALAAGVPNVRFFEGDVLGEARSDSYDVVFCSLFLHHFDEDDAIRMLKKFRMSAIRLVLVDDLCRSRAGLWLAWLGGRLLSRSPVVHYDAPVSVSGAFTPAEARALADAAGFDRVSVTRHFPERFLLLARPE